MKLIILALFMWIAPSKQTPLVGPQQILLVSPNNDYILPGASVILLGVSLSFSFFF